MVFFMNSLDDGATFVVESPCPCALVGVPTRMMQGCPYCMGTGRAYRCVSCSVGVPRQPGLFAEHRATCWYRLRAAVYALTFPPYGFIPLRGVEGWRWSVQTHVGAYRADVFRELTPIEYLLSRFVEDWLNFFSDPSRFQVDGGGSSLLVRHEERCFWEASGCWRNECPSLESLIEPGVPWTFPRKS